MKNSGGGKAADLEEDIPKAERFLQFLQKQYPNKPVKYVLSTHWHLHSLSGITPFFNSGAKLVTAKSNWDYSVKNGLFKGKDVQKLAKKTIQITKDSTLLGKTKFPIQVLFLDKTYTHKPTTDYLFFYMPKDKNLHASCMCAMSEIDFKEQPDFIYSDRITDIEKSIKSRNIEVKNILKMNLDFDKTKKEYKLPIINGNYFEEFKKRGKPAELLISALSNYDFTKLKNEKTLIINNLIAQKTSPYFVNSTVYNCIKIKEFKKAVEWAQILNLYEINNPNYLDTLGEAYYNADEQLLAQNISDQLLKLNSKLSNPLKSWEENKKRTN